MLMNIVNDTEGVLLSHHVPTGEMVKEEYYKTFLGEHLTKDSSCGIISGRTELKEMLSHLPYSPNVSQSDYKTQPLHGTRYSDLDILLNAVIMDINTA